MHEPPRINMEILHTIEREPIRTSQLAWYKGRLTQDSPLGKAGMILIRPTYLGDQNGEPTLAVPTDDLMHTDGQPLFDQWEGDRFEARRQQLIAQGFDL